MTPKALVQKKKKSVAAEEAFPLKAPRGTHDVLPQDQKYWEYVVDNALSFMRGWHFQQVNTPLFEETALFTRGVGKETDIIQKELFELKSRGQGAHYSLRPEGTASIVRAYIEHGMRSWPRPVKLFYVGPFFRYERPQAGRYRELHQFGLEMFGSDAPITDVEIIFVLHELFSRLGIEKYTVHINSLGNVSERDEYIKLLKEHYRRNRQKLCRDCKQRFTSNPLRLLDCKQEKCQQVANTAPQLLDHLSDDSKKHFDFVLSSLGELGVPYEIAPSLVRGLDYYTRTVFEFVPQGEREESQQSSLAAGGRYDDLVGQLGGRKTSAVGVAVGIERLISQIKEEGIELTVTDKPKVYVAQLGDQAKIVSLRVMKQLCEANIPFAESINRDGIQQQLRLADRFKVSWSIIIGQKEVIDNTVILRNMESGMQEVVERDDLISELSKRLEMV